MTDNRYCVQVVQNVGFSGLYRGATVCACRDMVFSGIYFPLFSTLKDVFAAHAHAGTALAPPRTLTICIQSLTVIPG
jgi:hypothetical protein